jgi:hypothetical protein
VRDLFGGLAAVGERAEGDQALAGHLLPFGGVPSSVSGCALLTLVAGGVNVAAT